VKSRPTAPVPVIAVTREEAARALGVSLSHFQRHIAADLRTIRTGSVRLYPTAELERWAERRATLLEPEAES
jgi:excisionase family DNA binding protein